MIPSSVKRYFNLLTKSIIYSGIIINNSSKLLYNVVILKYKKKSNKLLFSTMTFNSTKCKKSLYKLFLIIIDKIICYSQQKMSTWRCPNINQQMNTGECRLKPFVYGVFVNLLGFHNFLSDLQVSYCNKAV